MLVSSIAMRKSPVPPRQDTDLLTHLSFWHSWDWQYAPWEKHFAGHKLDPLLRHRILSCALLMSNGLFDQRSCQVWHSRGSIGALAGR